jgi:all-trans-retinol 13,14-reductase
MKMIAHGKLRKSFRNRLTNIPNTISVFGVHISLKPNTFPALDYNLYAYKNDDVWTVSAYNEKKWPEFYYLYTPASDAENSFAGCVSLYSYMHFDEVKKWADRSAEFRGNDYEEWKNLKAEKLIDLASQRFPDLKTSIVDYITATPLTYRDYIGTPMGAMYGTLRDYHDPMSSYVFPRTKLPNLYFTGQNINLHGMLGVSISSLMTCGEFLGLNKLIKEVNEA